MGDERKIEGTNSDVRDLVEKSKSLFLQELASEFRQRQAQYNLETEFAKTKQNRSLLVPVVVAGIVLFFLAGAVGVTLYIEKKSREVQVGAQAFESVNLRDVLDTAKRLEQDLSKAKKDLEDLQDSQRAEIEQARLGFQRESELIATSTDLTEPAKTERLQAAQLRLNRQLQAIQASYAPRIAAKEKEIQGIQKQMDSYDARQVQRAREQEEILNNQRRLYEMEMERTLKAHANELRELNQRYTREIEGLKKYQQDLVAVLKANHAREIASLILKYNPTGVSDAVAPLLTASIDPAVLQARLPRFNSSLLTAEGLLDVGALSRLSQKLNELGSVLGELKKIPFQNVVPSIIAQIEARQKEVAILYEQILEVFNRGIQQKNAALRSQEETIRGLNRYVYAVEQLLIQNREQGYVLDPREPRNLLVVVDKLRVVTPGSVARVFRRDDEYIGKIRYEGEAGKASWVVLELKDPQNPIRPFDKVMVEEQ
ncbi:MAG: hypothetical protein N2442_02585 [Spirochaetes bacterium]|nr:hypothetical protein [Spirochaetota bacterium]